MGFDAKANDWQVCCLVDLAAGNVIGAGLYVFDFYSPTVGTTVRFKFHGLGIGLGGNASGTTLPDEVGPFGPWSQIACEKPFGVWDLNGSHGRLTNLSVGAAIVVGVLYISAWPKWTLGEDWFYSQNVGGLGSGVSSGGVVLLGRWRFNKVVANAPASGITA